MTDRKKNHLEVIMDALRKAEQRNKQLLTALSSARMEIKKLHNEDNGGYKTICLGRG